MSDQTVVVFRRYENGTVIALFPREIATLDGCCGSYLHVGQHSAAEYHHVLKETVAASPEEYQALKTELEGLGYVLKVRQRNRLFKFAPKPIEAAIETVSAR